MPLLKRDWEKDVVYLVQIPRAGAIPSLSPYALKLETWLRVAGIKYEIPFVEFNGRELADTNLIIQILYKTFNIKIDEGLNEKERADWTAYQSLVEDTIKWFFLLGRQLFREMIFLRSLNMAFMSSPEGIGRHLSGFKKFVFNNFVISRFQKKMRSSCYVQGTGRFTVAEIEEMARSQFHALANLLGDKDFFFGSQPATFDCTVFGHLSQFFFISPNSTITNSLKTDTPNLAAFLDRMKTRFWPDWQEATANLSLSTKYLPSTD